jgi:hypothetical protein
VTALRNTDERLDPPHRPHWKSQLTNAQFGPMAEDLLAVALEAAGSGTVTIARPFVDCGVDLYVRRLRSLLVKELQVKAFRLLTADGVGSLELPVSEVSDNGGYLALVHLPEPYDQLYRRIFLVPNRVLHESYPRSTSHGVSSFVITVNFAEPTGDFWPRYAVDLDDLGNWLAAIPGWLDPVPVVLRPGEPIVEIAPNPAQWLAGFGRLWMAAELERVAAGCVALAEDRVRLDTVTLLLHHLRSDRFAGLHIRSQRISPAGTVHFEIHRGSFFIDPQLYVLDLLLDGDAKPHEFSLLIPSDQLSKLGFSETITIRRLTKKFQPYCLPTREIARMLLEAAFPGQ